MDLSGGICFDLPSLLPTRRTGARFVRARPPRRDLRAPGPFSPPFRRQTARRRKEKDPSLRRRETMLPVF